VDRCPGCGDMLPKIRAGELLLYCPSCGSRIEEGVKAQPTVQEATQASTVLETEAAAPPPVKPVEKARLEPSEERMVKRAEERLKLLERFLSSAARVPLVLTDPGTGETLKTYRIGVASVRVAREGVTGRYYISEPPLDPLDILVYSIGLETIYMKAEIPDNALASLARRSYRTDVELQEAVTRLDSLVKPHVESALRAVGAAGEWKDRLERVSYYIMRELFGYGVVAVPMEDPYIEDINVLGPKIYVGVYHRDFSHYRWLWTNAYFRDDDEINDYMNRLAHAVGHGLTAAKPYGDFALPSGDRFAGMFGRDISARGPGFTVRKFAVMPWSLPHMVASNMLSILAAAYLWFALEQKAIIGIAGPTGSGKTSLFNALLGCLHPNSMFYTIEDTYELFLPHRGWRATTVKRPSMMASREVQVTEAELIKMALRMRPDYIVVGEVRSEDAIYNLLNAAFTGHGGGFTFHADSASAFFSRLAIMLKKAELSESLLSFFWGCGITTYQDSPKGRLRRMIEVAEILPDINEPTGFKIHQVMRWRAETDGFEPEAVEDLFERSVKLKQIVERYGRGKDRIIDDIEKKVRAISDGIQLGIRDAEAFHRYLMERYYGGAG
jgi:archaeal flagellar protein FlaI